MMISKHKFHLAFENANHVDYVTEKVFSAFAAGVVPVYMGAPNINQFIPDPKSIINVNDFKSVESLANYLKYLANNETAYNEYHEWRKRPPEEIKCNMKKKLKIPPPKSSHYGDGILCRFCYKIQRKYLLVHHRQKNNILNSE